MLHQGRIISDIGGEEKKNLTVDDLLQKFYSSAEEELVSDAILLAR
jgi:putative ABC transport system ATP-binding protein